MSRFLSVVATAAVLGLAAPPVHAQVPTFDAEYDPYSQAWNGMASFVGLAEGMGFTVDVRDSLEWDTLEAKDILFVVFPLHRVDPSKLAAYVQAGGNVVIADDFGDGKEAMQAMGLLRIEVEQARSSRFYEGRMYAPIANARGDHPLAREVGDVVTNHPAVMTRVEGASTIVGLDDGAIVVAGERGFGKYVAVSDPSIFINRMMQFPGNVQLTGNIFNWLDRGNRRARNIVLLRGKREMFGHPPPFIDDAKADELGRSISAFNDWLYKAREWLLTPAAMKTLAALLAASLFLLALLALPVRRGPNVDGAWLRFNRPARRDEPHALVNNADTGSSSNLVLACILRDHVQRLLAELTHKSEPLYTVPESQLVAELSKAKGTTAAVALTRVYKRLRALPSRGQAAAPWSAGHLARREFDTLYRDVVELCRTLGSDIPDLQDVHETSKR
ncbi:MAG: DUF4350 domain-containing protein [Deltaproteobacteria bacterium]|nr:DUF4350 domain-containing protein [Deltaproteobacteria bacterium]